MKCIGSTFRFVLPIALLLATTAIATSLLPAVARADYVELGSWTSSDGTKSTVYQNDDGKYATYIEKGDKANVTYLDAYALNCMMQKGFKWAGEESEGDAVGKGSRTEPIDVASLIAKGLITIVNIKANPENTPLAKFIDSEGGGLIPHWDPSYDDNKGRPGLPNIEKDPGELTDKQKAEITRLVNYTAKALEGIGTSMLDGVDALGGESAPTFNKSGSSGRKKGTSDGSGNNDNKTKYIGSGFSLGPRPDLVNPPHSKTGKSGVISPGLLEGGAGFGTNGPAGTGTPGSTSSSGGAKGGAGAAGIR